MIKRIAPGTTFGRWSVTGPAPSRLGKQMLVCSCACGSRGHISAESLRRGKSKSCGCLRNETAADHLSPAKRGRSGDGAAKHLFRVYANNAARRSLSFDLTFDEFKAITSLNCSYCGAPPGTVHRQNRAYGDYMHNGVDRVENSLGYTLANSVPCCRMCNIAKSTHSLSDFKSWAVRLYKNLTK